MLNALNKHSGEETGELLASMKRDVEAFVKDAPQFDDITMLALHYYGCRGDPAGESWDLTIDAKTENLTCVFDFLKEHLDARGCSARNQAQIKLAAEEIFVNVANYAYNPNVGPVTVRLAVKGDVATVTFIDNGVPYDPTAKPDPDVTLPAVERSIGGLGIYMAKNSMDSVSYEYKDGQNVLHMQKRI
jgi:sigma-B regulation protein RsbU (phosphoserine phosphatase)